MRTTPFFVSLIFSGVAVFSLQAQDAAKQAMLDSALKQRPVQTDVDIDIPTAEEAKQCEIQITGDNRGMIVLGPQKQTLRLFLDTDGDAQRQVDQWSYFNNGVEVYRENDTNGNSKRDRFRWMNTAGTRWGVDENEDGVIDYWKEISPEEVSREIVLALATNDEARFLRVALNEEELKSLALGEQLNAVVARKVEAMKTGFKTAVQATAFKEKNVQWYQLNAVLPGTVPKGDRGNGKDLVVYENAMTTVGDGNETKQIAIGTLVKIDDNNWRTLDVPKIYDDAHLSFTFIQPSVAQNSTGAADSEVIALMTKVQEIQTTIPSLPEDQRPGKHKEVIGLMIQIIAKATTNEERDSWIQQLADAIMTAVEVNEFPQGSEQIKVLFDTVDNAGNEELAAYVKSRQIMTDLYTAMHEGKDSVKSYTQWLADLEDLVNRYEKTEAGVDSMMQLASNKEMTSTSTDEPLKWYRKVAESAKPIAEKAKGAIRRLTSPGKTVAFQANDINGKAFDIVSLKGKVAVLCFWDNRSIQFMKGIKDVVDKYAAQGVQVVGVNLDNDAASMKASVARSGLTWPQLFVPGGYESPIAVYWGIPSTPYMIVYGKDGNVVQATLQTAEELEQVLSQLTK